MIRYHVAVPRPETHRALVHVELEAHDTTTALNIPVWTPGSYLVREFSRYIGELTALDAATGEPLRFERTAKGRWELATRPGQHVRVSFSAFCHELTVRTPHIDHTHAFFTGTNLLPWVDGRLDEPASLRIGAPDGWSAFCPLESADGVFLAPDYDTLADAPIELGPHRALSFEALGVPHRVILWGDERVRVDTDRLCDDLRRIVLQNAAIFGGLPYRNYDFILHITADGRGGLEHLNSTVLATPWRYFDTDEGYRDLLGLAAHEHFHVWNVKRIKPASLVPFRYDRENYTRGLWVSEGFTTYFDDLVCTRAGLWTREQLLESLRDRLQRLHEVPGRNVQTLEDASFDAWIRLYRPDDDTPFRTVSYYLKGSVVALGLDLTVRAATRGARSLDDVMRLLWRRWGVDGRGFPDDAMPAIVHEATGVDVSEEIARWVRSTDEVELGPLFASHGLRLAVTAEAPAGLGWDVAAGAEPVVRHVVPGSPAERAGIAPGDVIIAVDGRRATADAMSGLPQRLKEGQALRVHAFRRSVLCEFSVAPEPMPRARFALAVDAAATAEELALLDGWLSPVD